MKHHNTISKSDVIAKCWAVYAVFYINKNANYTQLSWQKKNRRMTDGWIHIYDEFEQIERARICLLSVFPFYSLCTIEKDNNYRIYIGKTDSLSFNVSVSHYYKL